MTTVFYVEEIGGELFDRPAKVLSKARRCAICHEALDTHDRPGRRHAYTPEEGLSLRVTFPAGRRRGLPAETVDYPFVAPGTGPNQYHE